ncbi:MAG: 23S rRNA (pseudouridine(1915)-N(3))-methyltransferase RlmH [Candidatus Ancillula sp.]|jgi:23S rRNA (pseudouridine1915-N3)-methyltransferase|nr:23S rRNA (pseudouridine(1915)-N(3))-methyltransferase RlmH [Candidatus Ancillula sp.]
MSIKLIAVGKTTDYETHIANYIKRLKSPFNLNIKSVPYSDKNQEGNQILKNVNANEFVILLDERGEQLDNFSFKDTLVKHPHTTLIIGGAYGVSDAVFSRANFTLSLSRLVLPHEIVRLILVEQIYRSQAIFTNHPYHHT